MRGGSKRLSRGRLVRLWLEIGQGARSGTGRGLAVTITAVDPDTGAIAALDIAAHGDRYS